MGSRAQTEGLLKEGARTDCQLPQGREQSDNSRCGEFVDAVGGCYCLCVLSEVRAGENGQVPGKFDQ